MTRTKNQPYTSRSEQKTLNLSVDDDFDVLAVELLGYDSSSDSLKRVAVNADGELLLDTASLDSRYVNADGDTMTGDLTMSGSSTQITFPDNSDSTGGLSFGGDVSLYRSAAGRLFLEGELKLEIFSNTAENATNVSPIFFQGATNQSAALFVMQQGNSQSGDMMQLRDSGGGTNGLITADGRFALRYIGAQSATLAIGTGYSEYRALVLKANSTQNVNLMEVWNSSGSTVWSIDPSGNLDVAGEIRSDSLRLDQTPTSETITPTHTITLSVNGTDYKIPIVAA